MLAVFFVAFGVPPLYQINIIDDTLYQINLNYYSFIPLRFPPSRE